ncbi:SH3 domain-containing protein [Reichenbachiella versicolor]|uniref:SH3 domain-containing protein n=1 Tax=Reichenbachiella versicolor TaxID=1821036 RepID=UPI0013A57E0E|nr:SH3 domain-containing protein [Reichenbachiella versicolor]
MGFIENLAKGFVRSAVNQIGRDGGRIISNKVYKDTRSTPIQLVGFSNGDTHTGTSNNSGFNSRQDLKGAGYKTELFRSNVVLYFFMVIGCEILPIFGPLYWVYLAFRNFFKKYTRFYCYTQKPVYVQDRRYKTGQRHDGYTKVKEYSDVVAKPVTSERIVFIIKGLIALGVAISLASFQYSIYDSWNKPTTDVVETINLGTVLAERGLNMRTSASGQAEILTSIPFNESIEVISTDGPEETIGSKTANWMKVKYKEETGWVWGGLIKTE